MTTSAQTDTSALSPSPGIKLLLIALIGLAACCLVTVFALQTPWLGLRLQASPDPQGLLVTDATGPSQRLSPDSQLLSLAPAESSQSPRHNPHPIELQELDITEDPSLLPSFHDVRRFYARQTDLSRLLHEPRITLLWQSPDGQLHQTDIAPLTSRPLASLPGVYWIQLASGLLALLIGSWVWVLQPRDWGARMFALTGAMMLTFTLPAAWYSTRELALNGQWFALLSGINMTGAILFGCALIGIFLCFPRHLVSPRALLWLPIIFGGLLVADLLHMWPIPIGNLLTLLQTLLGIACVIWQWQTARFDPAARAALRWVALSAILGAALFVVPIGSASLLGTPLLVSQGASFMFFLLMYAGIALGVARFRLFDLDEWAYRILLWVTSLIALLLLDAAFIWLLHLNPSLSLCLAVLLVGFLYLPLRNWLWQRLVTRHSVSQEELFRGVLDIVLESHETRRVQQWRKLLNQLFQPLEIRPLEHMPAHTQISQNGLCLDLPATSGSEALRLRFPWRGRGLFSRKHLHLGQRLLAFLQQADLSRAEFERGVLEERQRISRDLHDDIASRLVASLHTTQDPETRRAIRSTLQDLRTTLSGLSGEAVSFQTLISRIQEEAAERLHAANIALDWDQPDHTLDWTLAYPTYKNVLSAQREIISNILRHSHAQRVTIRITPEAEGWRITTSDYRQELPTTPPSTLPPSNGLGMANLRERMSQVGGAIEHYEHEHGRSVSLWLPTSTSAVLASA